MAKSKLHVLRANFRFRLYAVAPTFWVNDCCCPYLKFGAQGLLAAGHSHTEPVPVIVARLIDRIALFPEACERFLGVRVPAHAYSRTLLKLIA